MSKTIKLDNPVYDRLDALRIHKGTFSHAVERLLDMHRMLRGMEPILRGHIAFRQFQEDRAREKAEIEGR